MSAPKFDRLEVAGELCRSRMIPAVAQTTIGPLFDPRDPTTWLPTLTLQQVAAIYQRPEGGIRRAAYNNRFTPAPKHRHPLRWRKVDVVRDLGLNEPMQFKRSPVNS